MIKPHKPVEDSDYFALLPQNGLQLADQLLQQDYERLAQSDLPVRDTVSGLLTIQSLQQTEQVSS
jgi:hypothetical protein